MRETCDLVYLEHLPFGNIFLKVAILQIERDMICYLSAEGGPIGKEGFYNSKQNEQDFFIPQGRTTRDAWKTELP